MYNVPRSKHTYLGYKTSQSMLHSETIAVCSEIHTEVLSAFWGQIVDTLNATLCGTYGYHRFLKCGPQ